MTAATLLSLPITTEDDQQAACDHIAELLAYEFSIQRDPRTSFVGDPGSKGNLLWGFLSSNHDSPDVIHVDCRGVSSPCCEDLIQQGITPTLEAQTVRELRRVAALFERYAARLEEAAGLPVGQIRFNGDPIDD